MRHSLIIALSTLALAACSSSPPSDASSRSTGGWTFNYDSTTGLSTATQTDADGAVSVRVTCQTPSGDMMLTDYRLGRARGQQQVRFTIGQETITVPGEGNGNAMAVRLPRRPPNLGGYAHLSQDAVSLSVGNSTHTYATGAVEKLALVANSCWPTGS